ncbi:hypothetical protein CFC21_029217 [Triticum aestivum]|uniref:RRM domain-containing protein n=3 Tax=Triticum TaxID=4564 RepID=A0A9R0VXL7_TRITD|nr:hypothetical protein CFC21_029217 [Triticum aestivum]VAH89137.1 unnamed protein product [Triticum turgidum subsp. durum]
MSYSRYRSRSRSVDSSDVENPGNNLFVTGLSSRLTDQDLEKHFSTEGEVIDASIVLDPWTRESRGFGFVTMATLKEAERCIKYLDRSVLEGRVITVEKQVDAHSCLASIQKIHNLRSKQCYLNQRAKRRRGRTPTPGRYLGAKSSRGRRYSRSRSPVRRDRYSSRYSPERERSYSPYRRGRSYSRRDRRRSYSRRRSYTPSDRSESPYDRRRSYSPYDRRISYSPHHGHRHRSRSPYRYSRRRSRSHDRSVSAYYSRRYSPRSRRRSYSRSISPRRSYSRSCSPASEESRSCSPRKGRAGSKASRSRSPGKRRSRESYAHSRSSCSRSVSRERSTSAST